MKKVLFFACAAALCLAVASCGNSQPAAEEEVATEVVEEVAADTCSACAEGACADSTCACCADSTATPAAE